MGEKPQQCWDFIYPGLGTCFPPGKTPSGCAQLQQLLQPRLLPAAIQTWASSAT